MADESYNDLVLGYVQNRQSEDAERYLKSGRRFKDADIGYLKERWVELHREMINFDETNRIERDDVNAEIELRGEEIPFAVIKDEFQAFAEKMAKWVEDSQQTDSDKFREAGIELALDIEKFRKARDGSSQ